MNWRISVEPTVEPWTVDEVKDYLRVDTTDDDTLLTSMLTTARAAVERQTRRGLNTQTWIAHLDTFPSGNEIILPMAPLLSVTSVVYYDEDGASQTFDAANYQVDTVSQPGRIVLDPDSDWPDTDEGINKVIITYVVGYGATAASVPAELRSAILYHIAHRYELRNPVNVGGSVVQIPMSFTNIINRWKVPYFK